MSGQIPAQEVYSPPDEELLAYLTAAACPVVCSRGTQDDAWHQSCIAKAKLALTVLRSPQPPQEYEREEWGAAYLDKDGRAVAFIGGHEHRDAYSIIATGKWRQDEGKPVLVSRTRTHLSSVTADTGWQVADPQPPDPCDCGDTYRGRHGIGAHK